ncbi:MAG: TonB-dependent receptor [Spirosomaceae bacterium]|nr:TonB-dependent receptor [Spirosomataceae bacterium]
MVEQLYNSSRRCNYWHKLGLTLSAWAIFGSLLMAQDRTVSGTVKETNGAELPGVSVLVKGTTRGTQTDGTGAYKINAAANETLVFSFVGMVSKEVLASSTTLNVALDNDTKSLNEIVVIGYGSQKKKDVTGSITTISSQDFIKGNIQTPEQLVAGKLAGVQITSNSGAPGAGSRIRIRGGSSLNANNDPLIVIDGVPLESSGIAGAANALSFINPNDIETFSILKDASATAIYGSRASNGVVLITTKKGRAGDKLRVAFSSVLSSATNTKQVETLSADDFRALVNQRGNAAQKAQLGKENTNWQDEIYRSAFTHDNNLSLTGAIKSVPFRASVGYLDQNGVLKTSNMNRMSGSLGVSPSFLNNHLKVDLNYKGALINNTFADQGAIGSAIAFDPTQPIRSGNESAFGGYYEWLDPATKLPNTLAPRNPLGLLNMRQDLSNVRRSIMNAVFDYKFHFLPDLKANLNLGLDLSNSDGTRSVPAAAASAYFRGGVDGSYNQKRNNKTLEFYLNYAKNLGSSRFDVMAGYSYQDFLREGGDLDKNLKGEIFNNTIYKTQNTLVSFYGRANYTLKDRYIATFTLRQDGSSRFSPDNRWGTFPSAALAWKLNEESFLKNSGVFTDLKLRLGWGVTGQQDVLSDYPYLARYTLSESTALYQLGNTFLNTLRPEGYDANIKWEQTETQNIGLDFGIKAGRISGSVDLYRRTTKDLLSVIPVPAGSNLTNQILTNVGSIQNSGVEFTINTSPISNEKFNLDLNFNITYNKNEITQLTKVPDPTFPGILTGGISGGVGNTIQIHTVGYPTNTFYVFKQVYNEAGKPIEGLYEDLNNDGKITPDDRYRFENPNANVFLGFSAQASYKQFTAGFVMRGSVGNYMYNNVYSNNGVYRGLLAGNNYLANVSPNVFETGFGNNQYFSDYYLENASFARMDNISLGYNLGQIFNKKATASLSAIVQNAFIITKYRGLDPEIAGGIDNNFYPRPRTISLGINVNF